MLKDKECGPSRCCKSSEVYLLLNHLLLNLFLISGRPMLLVIQRRFGFARGAFAVVIVGSVSVCSLTVCAEATIRNL
jgi:hypothetical protein